MRDRFNTQLTGQTLTAIVALSNNFASPKAQEPRDYADKVHSLGYELDWDTLASDTVAAVAAFVKSLSRERRAT